MSMADSAPLISAEIIIDITRLGALGDGIGVYNGHSVYVPHTLPGEKIRAEVTSRSGKGYRAKLLEILVSSADRQVPPCSHFSQCGGCSLQHLTPDAYRAFKRLGMEELLERLGVSHSALRPLLEVGAASRRRAEFKLQVTKGKVSAGFYASRSHALIDLGMCPVMEEPILALLPPLRACVAALRQPGNILAASMTALEDGVMMALSVRASPKPADRAALIAFAEAQGLVRLVAEIQGKTSVTLLGKEACLSLGNARVALPDHAFLQASRVGQRAITSLVLEHLRPCRSVADLYAGCGTYSFPLREQGAVVYAFEGEEEMTIAMENARRQGNMEESLVVTRRDLFSAPLTAAELALFDGLVINPPRMGALPQVMEIGKSRLRRVVMVSCNPASFERDAASLLAAGFQLETLTPIDQFYWSAHLELVGCFTRL